jgi:hypothetical protein
MRRRRAAGRHVRAGCHVLAAVLIVLLLIYLLDVTFDLSVLQRLLVISMGLVAIAWWLRRAVLPLWRVREDDLDMALLVESRSAVPSDLTAALQFETPAARNWGSRQLRRAAIARARQLAGYLDVRDGQALRPSHAWWVTSLAGCLALMIWGSHPTHTAVFFRRLLLQRAHYPTRTVIDSVTVGGHRVRLPRPQPVKVPLASDVEFVVRGSGQIPTEGYVRIQGRRAESQLVLTSAGTPGKFARQLRRLQETATYQVFLGDAWTEPALLRVVPRPVVEVRLRVHPPPHTGLPGQPLETATLDCRVLAGSRVEVQVQGRNKDLARVGLRTDPGHQARQFALHRAGPDDGWALETTGTPLHCVVQPVSFELEAVDVDGFTPGVPIRGSIRLQVDDPPRVAAAVAHRVILPRARPILDYLAADDHALETVQLSIAVTRAGREVERQTRTIWQRPRAGRPQTSVRGQYPLELDDLALRKGDRVVLEPQAVDDRGPLEGQLARGDAMELEVSDESGVLQAISAADQESEKRLTEIIDRQLGIGASE